MEKTIKRIVSVLLLVVCIITSGVIMTGCGESKEAVNTPTQTQNTRSFTAKEVIELLDDEYQLIGKTVLSDICKTYTTIESIANFSISSWEKADISDSSKIGYWAYGTCSAYNKYGEYRFGCRFTVQITLDKQDRYTYSYYGSYSASSAAAYFYSKVHCSFPYVFTDKR